MKCTLFLQCGFFIKFTFPNIFKEETQMFNIWFYVI